MNSKGKGNSFERGVCHLLSKWWTDSDRTDVFWRTASSGGRATQRASRGHGTVNQYGDVGVTDPVGQELLDLFVIELKRGYNTHCVADLVDKGVKSTYGEWIGKLENTCKQAGIPYWWLIAKRDRRETLLFFPSTLWHYLRVCSCPLPFHSPIQVAVGELVRPVVGVPLEEFLQVVQPSDVRKVLRQERLRAV